MHHQWLVAVALAAMAPLLNFSTVGGGMGPPDACSRSRASASSVSFVVADGQAVRDHIPNFGLAPELDGLAGPLTVVILEGSHNAVQLFPPLLEGEQDASSAALDHVVCVLTADGVENYYPEVDLSGQEHDADQAGT